MQAVILCSGHGTRMGELTKDTPKPLLKIKGKTLLEYKLERLPEVVDEIILNIGYLGGKIKAEIGPNFNGKKVTYVEDKFIQGTAKALWQAKDILRGRFLVIM